MLTITCSMPSSACARRFAGRSGSLGIVRGVRVCLPVGMCLPVPVTCRLFGAFDHPPQRDESLPEATPQAGTVNARLGLIGRLAVVRQLREVIPGGLLLQFGDSLFDDRRVDVRI